MKRFFAALLCVLFVFAMVGCQDGPGCEECPEHEECPECEECQACEPEDLTPSPTVTPVVYHWVPGAIQGNVTAEVDLKGAENLIVLLAGKVLEEYLDYEFEAGELTIFGDVLHELGLELGEHEVTIVTENGTTAFDIEVVLTAEEATSIPTKTITDIDFSKIATQQPTDVIEGAPDLLITEIGVEMYEYSYVEIFNNTTEEYNLKNHRIVFANLKNQEATLLSEFGLFEEPIGMASGVYIYQDYKIPALSSAVLWIVASYPWEQVNGELLIGSSGRIMQEVSGAAAHLFGDGEENLSIDKFRAVYGLGEDVLVFPVRPQPCLMNGTSSGDDEGFGAAPVKGESNRFASFNSSVDDRGLQIQKFDLEKQIPVENVPGFETAAYYKYDVGVLNPEEEIYADGTLDRSKIQVKGGRESINAFYARIAYYDAEDNLLGYANKSAALDVYNANTVAYLQMYREIVTPVSTALLYGKLVEAEESMKYEKWGEYRGLQYTLPEADSHLMRFIPLAGTRADYEAYFSNDGVTDPVIAALNTFKLSGVGPEYPEINDSAEILVFESEAYPTTYLRNGYNTIGRGIAANFTVPV